MPKQSPKEYFKSLQLLHIALVGGIFLLTVVLYFFAGDNSSSSDSKDWLIYVPPIVGIFGLSIHKWLFKRRVQAAKIESNLSGKLTSYRGALILKWALMEGPALVCLIVGMTTNTPMLYLLGLFFGFLLYLYKPSKDGAIQDLMLSLDDIRALQDENTILNIQEGGIT